MRSKDVVIQRIAKRYTHATRPFPRTALYSLLLISGLRRQDTNSDINKEGMLCLINEPTRKFKAQMGWLLNGLIKVGGGKYTWLESFYRVVVG
jgi:hypothetical protein